MKRIYVAGPYSADNVMDVIRNIRNGVHAATILFRAGYSPFCPWLDYHFVLMDFGDKLTIDDFYRYSIDWLSVSDALFVLPGYEKSKGTLNEIRFAEDNDIPIYYDIKEIDA